MKSAIIDAHHHVWDLDVTPQPWITGRWTEPLRGDFLLEHYAALVRANAVDRSILVQSVNNHEETVRLLALAEDHPDLIAGVVGWADFTGSDIAIEVAGLRAGRGGSRLVGLRHLVQDEPDDAWLSRPDVLRSLAALPRLGLSFDLLVLTPQLPAAIKAVREVPQGRFVLDHLAKPDLVSGIGDDWRRSISLLAGYPNVAAKISGLPVQADWNTWTVEDLQPALTHALATFGSRRLLFGTDWPVCTAAATYQQALSAVTQLIQHLPRIERDRIMGANAIDWYRLTNG